MIDATKRDMNALFKFKVGDRVAKRWRWMKYLYGRWDHGNPPRLFIGSIGTIVAIDPASDRYPGAIVVDFGGVRNSSFGDIEGWWIGASELDLLPSEEE